LAGELRALLDTGDLPDLLALQRRFAPQTVAVPEVTVIIPAAIAYDALLQAPHEWVRS
jgi:hypothetical protein